MDTIEGQKKLVKTFCTAYKALPLVPLSKRHEDASHDAPARGGIWISRTSFPAPPENDLRNLLYHACNQLKTPEQTITPSEEVPLMDVGVEFIGHRSGVEPLTPEPSIPEHDKLKALEKECESDMTILYLHGGGFYSGSPVAFRAATTRLARLTKARVASVRYRLAPIHTFPSQILDIFVAYMSLLYPPPNSHYTSVPANRIVLVGDSAGGNLCLSLIRLLLELHRSLPSDASVFFHDRKTPLPSLPAGVATCSAWVDQPAIFPSWTTKGDYDIFRYLHPVLQPEQPADAIWPSSPPREHPYCRALTLDHELVSPAAVYDWTGAPPMWFACGAEERCIDSQRAVAGRAAKCGVSVVWNEYEGMPHEFPLLMGKLPQAGHYFGRCAEACLEFIKKQGVDGSGNRSKAIVVKMPDCREVETGTVEELERLSFEEVRRRMRKRNGERKIWTGPKAGGNAKI